MAHYGTLTLLDNNREKSSVTFPTYPTTVISLPDLLIDWGALKTAIDAVTLCTFNREKLVMDDTSLSDVLPVSPWANRELKMRIDYSGDTSGKKFSVTIAGPDMDVLTKEANSDYIDITAGPMPALVTAMETFMRSPDDPAETITVLRAKLVGRNT